jgi:hypothetical protein
MDTWLPGDRSLVAGLTPPGAVRAEVVDDRGQRVEATVCDGVFAAALDQPNDGHGPVVCFRDQAGLPIRRPLPADYPSTPVEDAQEPCPACGAVAYDEYVPTESWRGGSGGPGGSVIPNPVVVCRMCGHEEAQGTFYAASASDDGEDEAQRAARLARARADARVQQWYSHALTLRAVTFPLYAAEGWPAVIGGGGSSGDELTSLTISHYDAPDADPFEGDRPRLEITTSTEGADPGDELHDARWALDSWVHNAGALRWPPLSTSAVTLWLRARDREVRAAVLDAARSESLISIDGTPEPFLVLTTSAGRWVAVRRHHDLTITIAGHGIDPATVTLDPIPDPAARLLGPEPAEDR